MNSKLQVPDDLLVAPLLSLTLSLFPSRQLNSSTPNEKKKTLVHQHSQTQESGPSQNSTSVTELDLTTTDAPSEKYWQHLAEARRRALEDSLCENEKLHNRNRNLEEELNVTNEMLDQARGLVEVLKEMLEENEADQGLDQVQQADEEDEEEYEETLDHTPPSSIEKKEPVDTNDQDD